MLTCYYWNQFSPPVHSTATHKEEMQIPRKLITYVAVDKRGEWEIDLTPFDMSYHSIVIASTSHCLSAVVLFCFAHP